ncbi:C40 family peptidase [Desulfobacterium sp. N47]|uniref:C40 family peptidase n=1 Tax=Desulfobacterium sp. N47 TaxID=3115210 RepID=UPI003C8D25A0
MSCRINVPIAFVLIVYEYVCYHILMEDLSIYKDTIRTYGLVCKAMKTIKYIFFVYFLLLLISGCTAKYGIKTDSASRYNEFTEQQLRKEVELWLDVPHCMGGTDTDGIDCSGFVMVVYDKLFEIKLPRDTQHQVLAGTPVNKNDLRAGDLVFFIPPGMKGHVGIYLGNGEFAHTSSRKGVMVSMLSDPYWNKHYLTSRRIFQ